MAKKKSSESTNVPPDSEEQKTNHAPTKGGEVEHPIPPAEELGELAQEVQTFLNRRHELTQKLNLEIEATERKLAELKRTLEMLSFNNGADSLAEKGRTDRKLKKTAKVPKLKQDADEKPVPEPSTNVSTAVSEGRPDSESYEN